eukprot:755819-Pelagomonas_calceolata.AAC.3
MGGPNNMYIASPYREFSSRHKMKRIDRMDLSLKVLVVLASLPKMLCKPLIWQSKGSTINLIEHLSIASYSK